MNKIEEKAEKFANDTTLENGNNHFRRKQAYIAGYKEAIKAMDAADITLEKVDEV